jgi:hypothetical protein
MNVVVQLRQGPCPSCGRDNCASQDGNLCLLAQWWAAGNPVGEMIDRLIEADPATELDWDAIIAAAAFCGACVDINPAPRPDLDVFTDEAQRE